MSLPTKLLIALALLGMAFASGLFYGRGQKEVVVTEGKTVEKVVERIVTVTKVIRPDGTIEETTKTEDKSADKSTASSAKATKSAQLAQYGVGVSAIASFKELTKPQYGVTVSRRLLGPVWLELQGTSGGTVGLGARVEF